MGYQGWQGEIAIQTDGAGGSAGWDPVETIGDAALNSSKSTSPRPKRGTKFKSVVNGQKTVEITADLPVDDADAQFTAIESAYWGDTHLGVRFHNKESGRGITADFIVTEWNESQPAEGTQTVSVKFELIDKGTEPAWA